MRPGIELGVLFFLSTEYKLPCQKKLRLVGPIPQGRDRLGFIDG
jgi:hypothetical protein